MGSNLFIFILYTQIWKLYDQGHMPVVILSQIQISLDQGWRMLAVYHSQKRAGLYVNILHRDSAVYKLKIAAC